MTREGALRFPPIVWFDDPKPDRFRQCGRNLGSTDSKLTASISGHMAEKDDFFPPAAARALEARLRGMGKDVTLTVHPGTGHAFMAGHNALGTHNAEAAAKIWPEVVSFLKKKLQ